MTCQGTRYARKTATGAFLCKGCVDCAEAAHTSPRPLTERERYGLLCDEVREHQRRYYQDNAPIISDRAFDLLYEQILSIEAKNPAWITSDSPSQIVGH